MKIYIMTDMEGVAGDLTCCDEVTALVPAIETVSVKEGLERGAPPDLTAEEARRFNGAAIHLHPQVARDRIREGARRALTRRAEIPRFWIEPPYELLRSYRPREDGTVPPTTVQRGDDLIRVLTSTPQPA